MGSSHVGDAVVGGWQGSADGVLRHPTRLSRNPRIIRVPTMRKLLPQMYLACRAGLVAVLARPPGQRFPGASSSPLSLAP